ncbi:MAG: TIM barrel protein [Sedimentisphaerales bacterium]|nr:TIM barrel protein [Sedimentisphaerales bacterium]
MASTTRRAFIRQSLLGAGAIAVAPSLDGIASSGPRIEISLAEWSLHRAIYGGKLDPLDFPAKAKRDFGILAVEYVNGFFGGGKMDFREAGRNAAYLKELLKRSADAGVVNHLLMVDDEGPLAATNEKARLAAVENHTKWLEAANVLGCKTVRVNLQGDGSDDQKRIASVDSLGRLGELAGTMKLNVVAENHGGVTSNGAWLASVVKQVSRPNVGTLPDFGNFCISQPWGTTQDGCENMYDRYKGMAELLPFAKGVSAKSYDFDAHGEQPLMDYRRLIGLVKASGYKGYVGIEFEGNTQSEEDGIRKTKALLEKYL